MVWLSDSIEERRRRLFCRLFVSWSGGARKARSTHSYMAKVRRGPFEDLDNLTRIRGWIGSLGGHASGTEDHKVRQ